MRRREGLDYFPLDCHMDDSVRLIEAELGLSGFALLIKLWQEIYKNEGYYKRFDEDVQLLFAKEVNVPFDFLKEFLELAFKREIFDRELFEKYEILTSKEIQERFKQCTKKRKENTLIKEYALIFDEKGTQSDEKGAECEQSKVKESKVKESKVKESKVKDTHPPDAENDEKNSSCYGEYKNVYLTDAQRENLLAELGEEVFSDYVKRIDEYIEETGKAYKDVYLTIKRWHRQDKERGRPALSKKKKGYFGYTDTNEKKYKEIDDEILKNLLEED